MHCDLCGTKVKVVGDKTKHYEPVVDREKIETLLQGFYYYMNDRIPSIEQKRFIEEKADAIISAMYGKE